MVQDNTGGGGRKEVPVEQVRSIDERCCFRGGSYSENQSFVRGISRGPVIQGRNFLE